MTELEHFDPLHRATPTRPLLGMTILVVEDSRYACDAMRLLCLRSGARIRRADCLRSARRHLQVYQPTVVIVDLGLPDGDGTDLIAELAAASPRIPAIIGTSGDVFAADIAIAAGADQFLAKPVLNVAAFQAEVLAALPETLRPLRARLVVDETITPDPIAYREDMEHIAAVLSGPCTPGDLTYVQHFAAGVARAAGDTGLQDAVAMLTQADDAAKMQAAINRLAGCVDARVEDRLAI
ncbi:response regulator [Pseudoprimorskyibacter insulae]|uniref:Virulence transcriptional regulatory protein PhoP n=1 Tax=Pseudoprimorskyibacter insulae TaxID=1695997 RepID=A0A2R8AZA2_9RHOB|nr:response regulator [Pseudoprimorskyibacter insulae]SPF81174.1 Virulence transcriptional regulatory protein PhoP [Pseudoprimorskyibacter insulae]